MWGMDPMDPDSSDVWGMDPMEPSDVWGVDPDPNTHRECVGLTHPYQALLGALFSHSHPLDPEVRPQGDGLDLARRDNPRGNQEQSPRGQSLTCNFVLIPFPETPGSPGIYRGWRTSLLENMEHPMDPTSSSRPSLGIPLFLLPCI